jgi:hypothetical protein
MTSSIIRRPTRLPIQGLVLTLAIGSAALAGCRLVDRAFNRDEPAVPLSSIPPVRVETVDGRHAVVMTAPNPGWDVRFDAAEAALGHRRVLLTFTPPDPALIYPQVVVDKIALTDVPQAEPVRLAGRVVERRARRATGPYADLGVASPGSVAPSPATQPAGAPQPAAMPNPPVASDPFDVGSPAGAP